MTTHQDKGLLLTIILLIFFIASVVIYGRYKFSDLQANCEHSGGVLINRYCIDKSAVIR